MLVVFYPVYKQLGATSETGSFRPTRKQGSDKQPWSLTFYTKRRTLREKQLICLTVAQPGSPFLRQLSSLSPVFSLYSPVTFTALQMCWPLSPKKPSDILTYCVHCNQSLLWVCTNSNPPSSPSSCSMVVALPWRHSTPETFSHSLCRYGLERSEVHHSQHPWERQSSEMLFKNTYMMSKEPMMIISVNAFHVWILSKGYGLLPISSYVHRLCIHHLYINL